MARDAEIAPPQMIDDAHDRLDATATTAAGPLRRTPIATRYRSVAAVALRLHREVRAIATGPSLVPEAQCLAATRSVSQMKKTSFQESAATNQDFRAKVQSPARLRRLGTHKREMAPLQACSRQASRRQRRKKTASRRMAVQRPSTTKRLVMTPDALTHSCITHRLTSGTTHTIAYLIYIYTLPKDLMIPIVPPYFQTPTFTVWPLLPRRGGYG